MPPLVETVDLCKQYRSGQAQICALSNVSLAIAAGEFVAICGRSGSGKSTLMNILGLLERPSSGSYALQGEEAAGLDEMSRARIRNRDIGFIFQTPYLLPRATALENVELPLVYAGVARGERSSRARDALRRVSLAGRSLHWPNQLSGGEQQRVVIARAIVSNPAVILADEPTGALDSATGDEILSLFESLHQDGRTLIVVTHAAEVAERAQRRITLHDGRIVKDDLASGDRAIAQIFLSDCVR